MNVPSNKISGRNTDETFTRINVQLLTAVFVFQNTKIVWPYTRFQSTRSNNIRRNKNDVAYAFVMDLEPSSRDNSTAACTIYKCILVRFRAFEIKWKNRLARTVIVGKVYANPSENNYCTITSKPGGIDHKKKFISMQRFVFALNE